MTGFALLLVRVPSLAQPMGADQSLYAYVGERVLAGGLPYVDAWDQKPPAIHYTYALLRALWASDAVVAAADLAAAGGIALLLYGIGRRLAHAHAGAAAALLFLLLSNPAFTRLGGVRVRAQCETFIALAVTAAVYLLARRTPPGGAAMAASGLLFGAAFAYKYNAAVYGLAAFVALAAAGLLNGRRAVLFLAGSAALPLAFGLILLPALGPLYEATITYNVRYSGETYAGPLHGLAYLLTFPVERARTDALWFVGGGGCAVLLLAGARERRLLVPVLWTAAGCLSMAINGSRGLPQYYVQVAPALALAAGCAGWYLAAALRARLPAAAARLVLGAVLVAVAVGVWRVNQFPKLVEQTWFDLQALAGHIERPRYLARFVDERKYTALGAAQLGAFMRAHSSPDAPVFLFGFTAGAYLHADRASASRFFWSRPVIAGFREEDPDYGVSGLLSDLSRTPPAVVALQVNDWAPDVSDSAAFFLASPPLADWLRRGYHPVQGPDGFLVWLRR